MREEEKRNLVNAEEKRKELDKRRASEEHGRKAGRSAGSGCWETER